MIRCIQSAKPGWYNFFTVNYISGFLDFDLSFIDSLFSGVVFHLMLDYQDVRHKKDEIMRSLFEAAPFFFPHDSK